MNIGYAPPSPIIIRLHWPITPPRLLRLWDRSQVIAHVFVFCNTSVGAVYLMNKNADDIIRFLQKTSLLELKLICTFGHSSTSSTIPTRIGNSSPRNLSNSLHVHIRKMRHSWAGQPNSCSNYNLTGWHLERRSETPLDSTNPKCWNWLRSHRYVCSLPNLWYRFFNPPATYSSNQWENQD